uniref:Large conductance mechanosensitive channel protein n=1 Tax=viral metagenome TaxID=1070528 RepID=A0A6C0EUX7_9ZZZZ
MSEFKAQFAEFITKNNVVGVTAGVVIGYSAKDTITSLVNDIILPLIILLISKFDKSLTKFLPGKGKSTLDITHFISQVITFILLSIITFFFILFAFNKLLGATTPPKK